MKNRRMRLMAIFAAGVLSVTSMGGIVTAHAEETLSVPAEEAGAGAVQMDGKDAQTAEDGSVAASEGLIAGSFKPSEIAQPAQDTYEYPFLGMKLGISKDLKEQMEKKNISMFTDERWNDNADAVTYATASWCTLTDEQKDAEVDKMGTGYDDWLNLSWRLNCPHQCLCNHNTLISKALLHSLYWFNIQSTLPRMCL